MADFKTHLLGAAVVSGIAATSLMMADLATREAVIGYFILGIIGGLLPDIDSDGSIPVRIAFNVLGVTAGFLAVFTFGQRYSLIELIILWLACFVGIRYGIFSLFTRVTIHRGLIHSIPAGAIFALVTTLLAYYLFKASPMQAWVYGAFVFLGFLAHLLLDECYSVDLLGMQIRRSFGSAFNLGSLKNPLGTLALYLAIIGLLYLSPPADAFIETILDGDIHRDIIDRLLPTEGWFNDLLKGPIEPQQR